MRRIPQGPGLSLASFARLRRRRDGGPVRFAGLSSPPDARCPGIPAPLRRPHRGPIIGPKHSEEVTMDKLVWTVCIFAIGLAGFAASPSKYEKDVIATSQGDLEITFLGHGTLMMTFGGKTIHIDPYGAVADYGALPKADLVLVTHEHSDHLDPAALKAILKPDTAVVATRACASKLPGADHPGQRRVPDGPGSGHRSRAGLQHRPRAVQRESVPPQGDGNGYVVAFGDKRVYIAGDTENTPEMKALKGIDVAFLPMNLPYTMTPEMVADAARAFRPKVLYPYHFGDTDTSRLAKLLDGRKRDRGPDPEAELVPATGRHSPPAQVFGRASSTWCLMVLPRTM
ncbi:MAG: MBL fold metallo-hydrolase [Candidatus Moduliflexus flocculans]|nr:MBL fold metallo-hydrolase [Candidatus Moduliflexus flocculans]